MKLLTVIGARPQFIKAATVSRVIASDSGGVQKEAYFHNRRCVIFSDETGRVELVEAGWNTIAGADPDRIAAALAEPAPPGEATPLYGAGDAAEKVVGRLRG